MKAASIRELKKELNIYTHQELLELCLKMAKFKKENKELLTYLLFEAGDEEAFIRSVQAETTETFEAFSGKPFYSKKKALRKLLRRLKQYIRFSKKKPTEVEILLHFCRLMKEMQPSIKSYPLFMNIYKKQVEMIQKAIQKLHEDLQFDYEEELEELLHF